MGSQGGYTKSTTDEEKRKKGKVRTKKGSASSGVGVRDEAARLESRRKKDIHKVKKGHTPEKS